MEMIRIPHVSLVDATGRRIGVYSDDPDWWQQLKLRSHMIDKTNYNIPSSTETSSQTRDITPTNLIENELNSSKIKLIKDDQNLNRDSPFANTVNINDSNSDETDFDDIQNKCNVIGETPLHIAIMYDDLSTVKFLIEKKGFDVNQRCDGNKFLGGFNSKLTTSLIQQSKYQGLAYYGEYPLAFAACFASKEIYDYLIQKGADPNLQGTLFIIVVFFIF